MLARNPRGRLDKAMQRIDAGYLYEVGDAIRAVGRFKLREVPAYEMWTPLLECRGKLTQFLQSSVYSQSVRGVMHAYGNAFVAAIDDLINRIVDQKLEVVSSLDQSILQQAYQRFEPAFQAELSSQVTFLVMPKGAYDVLALIENGSTLFPASLAYRAPEASLDVSEGAKALAFELWSAAAFHFHRANEAVLRRYFDLHMGEGQRPKSETMGTLLRAMEKAGKGTPQVIVALQNIKDFHRNPNAHPGSFIEDAEEAFSLVAAIRCAMGYMLVELPFASFTAAMEATPNPEIGPLYANEREQGPQHPIPHWDNQQEQKEGPL